jgi:hypothetical protein
MVHLLVLTSTDPLVFCIENELRAGKSYLRGRLCKADSLALTSLDQFILIFKIQFTFFAKTRYLNKEVNCTEPSPSVIIPCLGLFLLTEIILGYNALWL